MCLRTRATADRCRTGSRLSHLRRCPLPTDPVAYPDRERKGRKGSPSAGLDEVDDRLEEDVPDFRGIPGDEDGTGAVGLRDALQLRTVNVVADTDDHHA